MTTKKEQFLEKLEELADIDIPGNMRVTFYYVNGEKDSFDLEHDTRAKTITDLKHRKEYYYIQNTIINLKNVTKIHFEELEKK